MTLFVFGINHNTAPVKVRERVAFAPESTPFALQLLLAETPFQEVSILSTCNRTEIYGYMATGENDSGEPNEVMAA